MTEMIHQWSGILLWGFIATCAMASVQEGTQHFGFSRMSFPFLIGTFFSGNRRHAEWAGFACYIVGGWVFAVFYRALFVELGMATWWLGALIGLLQGIFMLVVVLPMLPSIHPRMASPYDGPEAQRRVEPPGFMALHYGIRAPIIHILGQMVYGAILGAMLMR
jgi:hypothetical protein